MKCLVILHGGALSWHFPYGIKMRNIHGVYPDAQTMHITLLSIESGKASSKVSLNASKHL